MEGKYWKDGEFWLIEVPEVDVMTQGHTEKEALEMIADAIEGHVNVDGFKMEVTQTEEQKAEYTFTISPSDPGLYEAFAKWRKTRQSRVGKRG